MIDENLPKRDDAIYKEIEAFEEFELTECITYELAIRNIDNIVNITNYIRECIDRDMVFENDECKYKDIVNKAGFDGKLYINYPFFKEINSYIREKTNWIEDSKRTDGLQVMNNILFEPTKSIGTFTNSHTNVGDTKHYIGYSASKYFSYYKSSEQSLDKYIGVDKASRATPLYKRPQIKADFLIRKNVDININLSLPKKELFDLVSKLKDDFDNNQTIKAPIEILKNSIEIDDKEYKNTKAQKWADYFYIYDYFKQSTYGMYTNIDILITDLDIYYKDKEPKSTNEKIKSFYGETTIKNKLNLMKSFIDEKKYIKLLT